jgi:hypothetical protein
VLWRQRLGQVYTDDANALSAPQWLTKLMDYIHTWLNKWRMQEFHQKQGDGISP